MELSDILSYTELQRDLKYEQKPQVLKGNCDSLYGVWTFYYIRRVARTNRPCGVGVGAYTYTIPQFVIGSFKLESVPLPEGSILDLGVNVLITTGGPQPVTCANIYAITHFNTLNPCPLSTVCHQ